MTLFLITGELGAGKTLTLTFLTWKNWFYRKKKVFSNYHLYKIPYFFVNSVQDIDLMRDGWFAADEFWLWVDALESRTKKNRIVTNILLKSRKRDLTYCYTSQTPDQINKRVRKVQDFVAYPIMNAAETLCRVNIFRGTRMTAGTYMKTIYFKTYLFMQMYDHREEVQPLLEEDSEKDVVFVFQENPNAEPKFFDSWEEADSYAENWWKENWKELKVSF